MRASAPAAGPPCDSFSHAPGRKSQQGEEFKDTFWHPSQNLGEVLASYQVAGQTGSTSQTGLEMEQKVANQRPTPPMASQQHNSAQSACVCVGVRFAAACRNTEEGPQEDAHPGGRVLALELTGEGRMASASSRTRAVLSFTPLPIPGQLWAAGDLVLGQKRQGETW